MIGLGFGIAWFGYLYAIYGYTLLKGYDITWKSLANPVNAYQWPKPGTQIPMVPENQILPTSSGQVLASVTGSESPVQTPSVQLD